jgi:23S rRNA (uracil1939-C5)-methyltransferase
MALPETLQGLWKIGLVRDALRRIGGVPAPPLEPMHSPVPALAYRNRAEFSLSIDPHARVTVGFHSVNRPRELVAVDHCAILEGAANRVLATAREYLSSLRPTSSRRRRPRTDCRLIIRRSSHSGEIVVVLRETEESFPGAEELAALLSERHAEISGVILARGQPGRRGGARVRTLRGRPWLEEPGVRRRVRGRRFGCEGSRPLWGRRCVRFRAMLEGGA